MNAKQRYLEQMAERKLKNKFFTTRKLISFSLAMAFLGVSIVLIGIIHGISSTAHYTAGIGTIILAVIGTITLQGAVVCSALGVLSTKYTLHCISCTSLAVSLALDIALIVYYALIVV